MGFGTASLKEKMETQSTPFDTMLSIVTNKRALEGIMQRGQWELEKQREGNKSDERRQTIAGEYGLEQQRIAGGYKQNPYERAATLAKDSFTQAPLPQGTDYNTELNTRFRYFLSMLVKGETLADGGGGNPAGAPFEPTQPSLGVPWASSESRAANPTNPIDAFAGKVSGARKDGNNKPVAAAKAAYKEGQTATNPQTGQKIVYRGGKWQILK